MVSNSIPYLLRHILHKYLLCFFVIIFFYDWINLPLFIFQGYEPDQNITTEALKTSQTVNHYKEVNLKTEQ